MQQSGVYLIPSVAIQAIQNGSAKKLLKEIPDIYFGVTPSKDAGKKATSHVRWELNTFCLSWIVGDAVRVVCSWYLLTLSITYFHFLVGSVDLILSFSSFQGF